MYRASTVAGGTRSSPENWFSVEMSRRRQTKSLVVTSVS